MAKGKKASSARKRKKRRNRRPSWVPHMEGGDPGAPPGTLEIDPDSPRPEIRVFGYGPQGLNEARVDRPEDLRAYMDKWPVTWVNVDGLGDANVLQRIGEVFDLHPLALEDVVHVHQRAKTEQYKSHFFVVTHMVRMRDEQLDVEQVSLFLGEGYVLTFQEHRGDCLDPVRERIRHGRGRVRKMGADYLAYAILDAVIDHYFPVLEAFGERLENLEKEVLARPTAECLSSVLEARRELLFLRRLFWPEREAVAFLGKEEHTLISADTRVFLRDAHDHVTRIIEAVEGYRELSSGLLDVYMSSASHRMNEVMKVLTIIATIFIPLTFIAGVYGMNFDPEASPFNMPELGWYYGYPGVLGVMALISIGLVLYFWRKGWLGGEDDVGRALRKAGKDRQSP